MGDDSAREAEARFRAVLELASDWYWEQDAELRFTAVIRPKREPPGWAREILGKRRWELSFENMGPGSWDEHRALVEAHKPFRDLELCRRTDRGETIWFAVSGDPVFDSGGAFRGYRGIGRNISDRHRAEEALRESEQRFKAFMDHSPAVAWIKDSRLRYRYLSTQFENLVGRRPEELLGRDDLEAGWPDGGGSVLRANDLAVLQAGTARQVLEHMRHPDGTVHHWLSFKFPLADETGALGVAGMAIDISERVRAEESVQKYSREVRELNASLVSAQENERRRVADDLHDLIGQNLTALGLEMAALRTSLGSGSAQRVRLNVMQELVDRTIESIRGVVAELHPPGLEELGLVAALHWYASEVSGRTGIKVSLDAARLPRLPAQLELAVFRIAQEALTNVAKHSQAKCAEVALAREDGQVRMSVTDDGTGFTQPGGARAARRGGFGLPSMRERVEALGGSMRVEFPGRGTRLAIEIPLPHGH
ncbi:MAG TPA: PAS domain S-box protein [Burkholderiales bacterium]|nr:PAS domain S-box protein [Burkholderiales bacterium]